MTTRLDNPIDIDNLEDGEFGLMPAGWYKAVISETEVKQNKAGTGSYLKMVYDITGPTHVNRKVFDNVTVRHSSETAQNIGKAKIADICKACGITGILEDTSILHGKELNIYVIVEPGRDGFKDRNVPDKFDRQSGAAATNVNVVGSKTNPVSFDDDDIPF